MPSETTIICDGCGRDITTTGNCEDYRLALVVQSKTPWFVAEGLRVGAVTAMAISPPLARNAYFCGLRCLDLWRAGGDAATEEER